MLIAGLSQGHKLGLAATGTVFILYSLVSAFVLPRRNPNFPGRFLVPYVFLNVLMFVAMMSAVLVFGKEKKVVESAAAETTPAATTPASTTTTAAPTGDAAAGKIVFTTTAGCAGCHTLKAAAATGAVGPNLDEKMPDVALITDRVTHGKGAMPPFGTSLTPTQISDVVAFVYSSTHP